MESPHDHAQGSCKVLTIDIVFPDAQAYECGLASPALSTTSVAGLYGVDPDLVRRFEMADLLTLKLSYPRPVAQGGPDEHDMHGGQQYVRLLEIAL
jgi:hypothetical protein